MIHLSVDTKVGMISACSDRSSPLQFTMTGLSSEDTPRDLRSSALIEEEGRGCETRLANVGFRSKEFRGFAKNLPQEGVMFGVLIKTFLQE